MCASVGGGGAEEEKESQALGVEPVVTGFDLRTPTS